MMPEVNFAAAYEATADEPLRRTEMELREAQRLGGVGSWQWDPATDTVLWSEELYRIKGLDPRNPVPGYKDHAQLYTKESWRRLQHAVEDALRRGTPYELEIEIARPAGT